MKAFLALTFLTALSLAAGVDWNNLKPLDIVVPVNPKHTYQEWLDIFAAQTATPKDNSNYKKGTEPQPDFAGKVHVPLDEEHLRITNGYPAERGQFPWQVGLVINGASFCGGSLISNEWVLTAAHCAGNTYQVILGANLRNASEDGALIVAATNTIVHERWNASIFYNDIALIKLPSPVTLTTFISPIRLRNVVGELTGTSLRVSGWGRTSDTASTVSPILNYVDLIVITNAQCTQTFGSLITPSHLCTATGNGQSACNGDSGGPLSLLESDGLWTEVGIVSFGSSAGCTLEYPAVFTRVTSYLSWISSNTGLIIG